MVKTELSEQGSFGSAAHFAIDPIQIMWKKKRLLLSLLAFPWFFPLFVDLILRDILPLHASEDISFLTYNTLLAIVQPFWAIAWIRRLISPKEKPSIKSYFTFDKYYWYFLGCSLLIQVLNIPMEYIEETGILHPAILLGLWIIWTFLILPINVIFPAIAMRKPFPIWQTWSLTKPFYIRYVLSIVLIGFVFFLARNIFIYIGGAILAVLYISTPTILQFLYPWWPQTLISKGMLLLVVTYLLTLPTLYYKEYLMKKFASGKAGIQQS